MKFKLTLLLSVAMCFCFTLEPARAQNPVFNPLCEEEDNFFNTRIRLSGASGRLIALGSYSVQVDSFEDFDLEVVYQITVWRQPPRLADRCSARYGETILRTQLITARPVQGTLFGLQVAGQNPIPPGTYIAVLNLGTTCGTELGTPPLRSEPFEVEGPFILGDVNFDGVVDFQDISAFIGVLSGGGYLAEADINGDCVVDFLDIAGFIDLLLGL